MGTPGESFYAASVRYVPKGNIDESLKYMLQDIWLMKKFAIRAFIGGLLAFLISAILLWV